jgi:hypothetical protein
MVFGLHHGVNMEKKRQCSVFLFMDNTLVRMIKSVCMLLNECVSFTEKETMKKVCCITQFSPVEDKLKERAVRLFSQITVKGN